MDVSNAVPSVPAVALERHRRLSAAAEALLGFAADHPECFRADAFEGLREDPDPIYPYPLQPWPTLVAAPRLAALAQANLGLCSLIKSLPQRIFGGDVGRMADFYGLSPAQQEIIAAAFEGGAGVENFFARGDYLLTDQGLRCLEVNLGANLGGWEMALLAQRYQRVPIFQRFVAEHGLQPDCASTFVLALQQVLGVFRRHYRRDTEVLRIAVLAPPDYDAAAVEPGMQYMGAVLQRILDQEGAGLRGALVVGLYRDLEVVGEDLLLHGEPVHVVLEQNPVRFDERIVPILRRGEIRFLNGPLYWILDDKRNLALLSDPRYRHHFDSGEQALLDATVPWTRRLRDETSELPGESGGERAPLRELALSHRQRLVLKQGQGLAGLAMHLGASTSEERWAELVDQALDQGDWVVQELVTSEPFVYQHGEEGWAWHEAVWGLFALGEVHGGGFLRVQPGGSGKPVNTRTGARESVLLEVPEAMPTSRAGGELSADAAW
ncbi:MAG: hypothetical protein SX243_14230 [Acidobacteriota bacterium]|nr:hypothetical protein [Acidobacteriota bacterium]